MLEIPKFETKKELLDFLVKNKESLISQKCSAIKYSDGFGTHTPILRPQPQLHSVGKAASDSNLLDKNEIMVKAVINTTNIMDSHKDVHIPGIWDKSLQENKRILHLQEHKGNSFAHIISSGDDLKAYTKSYRWKDLGYNAEGKTEALVFDSNVRKERNPYMHEQYAKGYVDNHSVGMRYIKLVLCVDDDDYGAEKEAWDKYRPQVINGEEADKHGYFWAVPEAKVIEGSAVPAGSNPITPTLSSKAQEEEIDKESEAELAAKKFLGL